MTSPQFASRRREHRASQVLAAVGRHYPGAWAEIDRCRQMRGKELPAWPSWCYVPIHGSHAVVLEAHGGQIPIPYVHHIGTLGALAAWRLTRGVYRYDPDVAAALDDSPCPNDLPVSALYRLPEWCVYLETPGLRSVDGRELAGAFVHLDWDATGADELRLLLDVEGDPVTALDQDRLIPIPLILGRGSIAEALARVTESGRLQAEAAGYRVDRRLQDVPRIADRLWPILSRALYLCADEPDLGDDRPRRPQPTRTKEGWRLFGADRLRVWDVGARIGAAIRRAREQEDRAAREAAASGRARPRAHIRRAHWRYQRHGPELSEVRLRWIPTTIVGGTDIVTAIHPVKP